MNNDNNKNINRYNDNEREKNVINNDDNKNINKFNDNEREDNIINNDDNKNMNKFIEYERELNNVINNEDNKNLNLYNDNERENNNIMKNENNRNINKFNEYERENNNIIKNENNRNMNRYRDNDREKNSMIENENNRNINKYMDNDQEKNNMIENENNRNINKYMDNDREKNSMIENENNKNINLNKEHEKEQNNIIHKENNENINNDNKDENENLNENDNDKKNSNSNNNNNNNNSNNDMNNNDEIKGNKNQNLANKKLENNTKSKLGENTKNMININQTKINMLSKLNTQEAKDNINLLEASNNKTESKEKINIDDNLNYNNEDTLINDKGQKSNTQINLNENNLDKSDNKIFKEDRTFKSINVYVKNKKDIKGSNQYLNKNEQNIGNTNSFDIIDEENLNNLNMVNGKVFNKKMKNGFDNDNDIFEDIKFDSIKNKEDKNTIEENNKQKSRNNLEEKNKPQTFAKDDNNINNMLSRIEMNNSNDNNASFKSIAEKVSKNIPSKNNSSFIKNKEIKDDFSESIDKNKNISQNEEKKENKDNNIIYDYNNTNNNNKNINQKTTLNNITGNETSKEEEIIFNKPILPAEYINKIRKDIKLNPKPAKLSRVFITKTYNTLNKTNSTIEEPVIIPEINICHMEKTNKIICIENKKDYLKKIVINGFFFVTKTKVKERQPILDSNMEDEAKLEDLENKKKKKKKKNKDSDDSYISVSVDNKNIFPNHKFKEDFLLKNETLSKKNQISTGYKVRNNRTSSNTKNKIKNTLTNLNFEKIKKYKDKYTIKNNNETLSSIGNISNKEIDDSNENKNTNNKNNNKENDKENNKNTKDNNSTRIRVHKYNKDKSNIKIKIKNPPSQNIEYQQIEIKPGAKGYNYRVIKKNPTNKFRSNKNYIKAKNKCDNNEITAIKIKSGLKPIKPSTNNKNINLIQSQNQEKNSEKMNSNKSFSQNSHTYDNQINIILSNKETHHMVGYERHFGKEANCPLCKNMKKKSQYMEEKIFGQNKQINVKPLTANPNTNLYNINNINEINAKYTKRNFGFNKKEEEKNLNNNILKDLNLYYIGQNKNRMKQNMYRDLHRKYSARKSANVKNLYRIANEAKNGFNRNSIGSFSDVEFPAINSYFHS